MSDFGQALLASISKRFSESVSGDQRIRQIARRVRDGTNYEDAQHYAERLGELLSKAMNAETGTLPYMSEEVAREVLYPLLGEDHDLICEAVRAVQTNMNNEIGVGMTPSIPELDTGRIDDLAGKISSYENFDDARWLIDEPVINFSESVVDQAVRDNAKKQSEAGLTAKIVRKAEPSAIKSRKIGKKSYSYRIPCRWCKSLEGSWEYGEEPDDVYRRHAFCRCTVTYKNGKDRQDVWSKTKWTGDDADAQRIKIENQERLLEHDRNKKAEVAKKMEEKEVAERIRAETIRKLREYFPRWSDKAIAVFYNAHKAEAVEVGWMNIIRKRLQQG